MKIPNTLYHLVPKNKFNKFADKKGTYNCKGFEKSNFIHTTAGFKNLKKVADYIFANKGSKFYEKPEVRFVLLIINPNNVKSRITFIPNTFYHIHGPITKEAYKTVNIKRNKEGKFQFIRNEIIEK